MEQSYPSSDLCGNKHHTVLTTIASPVISIRYCQVELNSCKATSNAFLLKDFTPSSTGESVALSI